jgi:LmbE family N-acetylglucosaminyl deacetylase
MTRTVLHFAAHPDDELIGPPATLMALRDAGFRIVNVVCGLGRPEQRSRRAAELDEASRLAGFEALVPEHPPIATSRSDDVPTVFAEVLELARTTIAELQPEVVVSATPHDRHPSHELVARALRDALHEGPEDPPCWWMWGLWSHLPMPTLGTAFEHARLEEILTALSAYRGELARNDYRRLVRAKASMNASLAPELLFGFGSTAVANAPYVELLTEAIIVKGRWLLGSARWLDPSAPFAQPSETDIGAWLFAESFTEMFGVPGQQLAAEAHG